MSGAHGHSNLDEQPFFLPTPEAQRRLERYMDAARAVDSTEFNGMLIMSLLCYVDDAMLDEAIDDVMRTISGGAA